MSTVRKFVRVHPSTSQEVAAVPPSPATAEQKKVLEEGVELLPEGAEKVLSHFGAAKGQVSEAKPLPGETPEEYAIRQLKAVMEENPPSSEEEPLGKLSYTELSEELLSDYLEADRQLKRWQEIRETLRGEIVRLAGQERGNIQRGRYLLRIQDRGASITFDWRQYIEDEIGKESLIEIENNLALARGGKQTWKYGKVGKTAIVVEVSEVKGAKPSSGEAHAAG